MSVTLDQALAHIQSGNLQKGQVVLAQLLQANIRNEQAWFLLAQCVSDPARREQCLQRVLALNPNHTLAQRLLAELTEPQVVASPVPDEAFQQRKFELTETMTERQSIGLESFQPREFELTADPDTVPELSAPVVAVPTSTQPFTPGPFTVAPQTKSGPADKSAVPPDQLPIWFRSPKENF